MEFLKYVVFGTIDLVLWIFKIGYYRHLRYPEMSEAEYRARATEFLANEARRAERESDSYAEVIED